MFYTKLQNRLRALLHPDKRRAIFEARRALKTLEPVVSDYIENPRLTRTI